MIVEEFTLEYYEEVIQIWKDTGISVGSSDTKEEIKKVMQKNPKLFLIGKLDTQVMAVVIGAFDGRRGYVHHLAVSPDYQSKGYGSKLMKELSKRFKKIGAHKVHLFIEKYNLGVIEFYKKLNWVIRDDLIMMSYVPDENLYRRCQ